MSARGRGGKTTSLTREQLQAMGCGTKDSLPQVQSVPPPTYPPLLNRPTKIENKEEDEKALSWKEKYLKHLHESPYFKVAADKPEATISLGAWEKWAEIILGPKKIIPEEYNWKRMPKELQLSRRKRKQKTGKAVGAKKLKEKDIDEEKLKVLEDKEKTELGDENSAKKNIGKSDDEDDDENGEEEVAADEEMDEENDYENSYFDNGEAYNEEDDNLDDGPIY